MIAVVEKLPKKYSWCARSVEWIKTQCDRALGRLYHESGTLSVSIADPDKVARKPVKVREDYARFLMHQKRLALPALASRIRNETLPAPVREHAVHTLALITRRRFHREPDKIERADRWLAGQGH